MSTITGQPVSAKLLGRTVNGTATGIQLADGSQIKANKLVVSTLNPHQLIFDLIGGENCDDALKARRAAR